MQDKIILYRGDPWEPEFELSVGEGRSEQVVDVSGYTLYVGLYRNKTDLDDDAALLESFLGNGADAEAGKIKVLFDSAKTVVLELGEYFLAAKLFDPDGKPRTLDLDTEVVEVTEPTIKRTTL